MNGNVISTYSCLMILTLLHMLIAQKYKKVEGFVFVEDDQITVTMHQQNKARSDETARLKKDTDSKNKQIPVLKKQINQLLVAAGHKPFTEVCQVDTG